MSVSIQKADSLGGLHHLMEAATALSGLVNSSSDTSSTLHSTRVVSDDEDESNSLFQPESQQTTQISNAAASSFVVVNSKEIFPQRLMYILSQQSISHIITWLHQGSSFVIIDPDIFATKILPQFFSETTSSSSTSSSNASGSKSKNKKSTSCKYPSFTRKLNRWGFRQISRGPDAGAFHHPLFQRENPNLCLEMVCQKSRRPSNSKPKTSPESGQPDSFDASKLRPLQPICNLSMKREINANPVTDTDSYASDTKALPPKKRKLRHSQVDDHISHNQHFPTSQDSMSISLEKSSGTSDKLILTSPLHVNSTALEPNKDNAHQENSLNPSALKEQELPSFHKSYLDSGAAQERSEEISDFLEKNLIELQRMNKADSPKTTSPSQSAVKDVLLEKLQGNLSSQINNVLYNVQPPSQQATPFSNTCSTTSTATNPLTLLGSIHSNKNNSPTPVTPNTCHSRTMKDAKDNLYRAYLQALSS